MDFTKSRIRTLKKFIQSRVLPSRESFGKLQYSFVCHNDGGALLTLSRTVLHYEWLAHIPQDYSIVVGIQESEEHIQKSDHRT